MKRLLFALLCGVAIVAAQGRTLCQANEMAASPAAGAMLACLTPTAKLILPPPPPATVLCCKFIVDRAQLEPVAPCPPPPEVPPSPVPPADAGPAAPANTTGGAAPTSGLLPTPAAAVSPL